MSLTQNAGAFFDPRAGEHRGAAAPTASGNAARLDLSIGRDLAGIETEWRAFEAEADCTAFQTFEWLSAWMRNIAPHERVTPAIVVGRTAERRILFMMPLAVEEASLTRRLAWLGSDLCDYNGPLLARDFGRHVGEAGFPGLWRDILDRLRADAKLRPDIVILEKMPETIGSQANPFMALPVAANPSGAYLAHLSGTWDEFYAARRSSATRRRDRTKRKRLAALGEVRFTTPDTLPAIGDSLSTLFVQKARSFAKMGVADIFRRPGWAEFYREVAARSANRGLVHVSRLEVGDDPAAVNLGLVFKNRYHHILASYDDGEVSRYGPGAAHLHDLMGYAIEHGCEAFDFTIGDEGYKRDWSDTRITLYDHRAALSWRGALAVLPATLAARLKRMIKQTPCLWQAATRLRALLGRRGAATPAKEEDSD
jgi:CelD/BcsL family acetyltransferase involved in cellulose biosynthesis